MSNAEIRLRTQLYWRRYYPVIGIFLLTQLLFVLGVRIGWRILPAPYSSINIDDQKLGWFVSSHFRWDAINYITIARDGYTPSVDQETSQLEAFFPLYPLSVRLLAGILGTESIQTFAWIAIVINLLASLGAFLIIYELAYEAGLDFVTAQRAVLFLAISPFAVFLVVSYTEALFLFLSAAFFFFVMKRKWIWAGIFAGLLSATRVTGVLFFILLLLKFISSYKKNELSKKELFNGIIALGLSLSGLVAYMGYLQVTSGDPFAFLHAQSDWNRSVLFPLLTLWRGMIYALFPSRTAFLDQYLINTIHTIFIFLFIVVAIASIRRWNWLYQVYGWILLLITLISPMTGSATMQSTARFMMVFFPVAFTLAEWGKKVWVRMTIFVIWVGGYLFLAALYGRGFFIG